MLGRPGAVDAAEAFSLHFGAQFRLAADLAVAHVGTAAGWVLRRLKVAGLLVVVVARRDGRVGLGGVAFFWKRRDEGRG